MSLSPWGLLQLAASNQPVSAAQVAEACDTPRDRAQLREALIEVATLRRGGANKAARDLAKQLSVDFVVREDPDELDVTGGSTDTSSPARGEEVPDDPAALASQILDRHQR